MSRLAEELRRRFGNPKKVLEILGIDAAILKEAREEALRLAQDRKLQIARDGYGPEAGHAYSFDPAVAEGERLWRQKNAADNEAGGTGLSERDRQELRRRDEVSPALDDATVAKIVEFLAEKGLDDDEIDAAFELIGVDRHRTVKDTIPQNGLGKRLASDAALDRLHRKFPGLANVTNGGFSAKETMVARPAMDRRQYPAARSSGRVLDVARHISVGG
jgi:hypothetical protein